MALLLFPCIRPLTCRTAAVFRVASASLPVQNLHTRLTSHVMDMPFKSILTSYKLQFPHNFTVIERQSCRCLTVWSKDENDSNSNRVSKSETLKTVEKYGEGKTPASGSLNGDTEQDGSYSPQHTLSKDGSVEVLTVSEPQTYGLSSLKEDVSPRNSPDRSIRPSLGSSNEANAMVSPADPEALCSAGMSITLKAEEEREVQDLPPPRPMEPSFTLAPYLAQSPVLQKLVALGVDLSTLEKVQEAADWVVQADWTTHIQPRLLFLKDLGVEDSQLGSLLSKNPLLLKEDVKEMETRISYFKSKNFSLEQIARIVTSAPLTLLLPVTYVDKKLGFLQKSFSLTGDEVRLTVSKLPKIIPWKLQKLKDIRFYMKDMLGFSDREMKAMLLSTPRVFLSDRHQLGRRFDLLHNVMGLSHAHLSAWPAVFRTRTHILEQRHRFLLLLGRAQYDPARENYVSLRALASGKDRDFCHHVAKASTDQFYSFLKSI